MKELKNFVDLTNALTKAYDKIPKLAATVAVNFSKERFREGAWLDSTKDKWAKRKINEKTQKGNRAILVESGRLKRSIRKGRVTRTSAIINVGGNGLEYAQIHNEGGRVNTTAKIKGHKRTSRKGRIFEVKAHDRKINFTMPKRKFIGVSATLDKRIELKITAELMRSLRK